MPVSAQIKAKPSRDEPIPQTIDTASPATSINTLPLRNPFTRWTRRSAPSSRDRSPSAASNSSRLIIGQEEERVVQVSVLVAMPTLSQSAKWDASDEAGVPDVVVGVAQLPYRTENPRVDDGIIDVRD
jgi:hypothetical protein